MDTPPNHLIRWNVRSLKNFLETHSFEIKKLEIKPIAFKNFLESRIRLGIAKKIIQTGKRSEDKAIINLGLNLKNLKHKLFEILSLFLFPFSLYFEKYGQGEEIYCLGKKSG